jgi:hypothetical protein
MSAIVKSHAVTATKIAQVLPLRGNGGGPMSPDAGVSLILADNTRQRWLIEDNIAPAAGDWLVYDADLHTRYLVTAEKFAELFTVIAD